MDLKEQSYIGLKVILPRLKIVAITTEKNIYT